MKLTHEEVLAAIPQRDPIMLVDEAVECIPGESIEATFYVSEEMPVFAGHFPGNPVLPGVYQLECAAQVSSLMYVSLPEYKGKLVLYLGVNNARFKKMVKPGDTMNLHVTTLFERTDKAIVTTHVDVDVEGVSVAEADVVQIYF